MSRKAQVQARDYAEYLYAYLGVVTDEAPTLSEWDQIDGLLS